MFFPLPLPDRNVRGKGVFSLVFTMMVALARRPFSGLSHCFGMDVPDIQSAELPVFVSGSPGIPAGSSSFFSNFFLSFYFLLFSSSFSK